jgi:hypothetical protein
MGSCLLFARGKYPPIRFAENKRLKVLLTDFLGEKHITDWLKING